MEELKIWSVDWRQFFLTERFFVSVLYRGVRQVRI